MQQEMNGDKKGEFVCRHWDSRGSLQVEKASRAQKYPKFSPTNANVAGLLIDPSGLSFCLNQLPFSSHIRTTSAKQDIVGAPRDKKMP